MDNSNVAAGEHNAPLLGFCGLGRMGGAIAERLRGAGYRLRVYDLSAGVRATFEQAGYEVVSSVAEAAGGADTLFLCLPNASAVLAAVEGEGGLLQSDPAPRLCVDLTSSDPETSRVLAGRLAPLGIVFVDAPVSGGVAGARAGSLTVMAGGDGSAVEEVRTLAESFAARVFRAGPSGSGDSAKAINNALSAASLALTAECLRLGVEQGYSAAEVVDAVNAGAGRSQNSEVKFPEQIVPRRFAAGFSMALMAKDVATAARMAERMGYDAPLTQQMHRLWSEAAEACGPQADFTEIAVYLEKGNGERFLRPQRPHRPQLSTPGRPDLGALVGRVETSLRSFTTELLGLARAAGLELERLLAIVNTGSGRNEFTRRLADSALPDRTDG